MTSQIRRKATSTRAIPAHRLGRDRSPLRDATATGVELRRRKPLAVVTCLRRSFDSGHDGVGDIESPVDDLEALGELVLGDA